MEKYTVEKVIGEGTYGIVYKAIEKVRCSSEAIATEGRELTATVGQQGVRRDQEIQDRCWYGALVFDEQEPCALSHATAADEQLSKREIQACSMLSHPYIVSYRHSFRHEGLLHLVFDFICDDMNKVRP